MDRHFRGCPSATDDGPCNCKPKPILPGFIDLQTCCRRQRVFTISFDSLANLFAAMDGKTLLTLTGLPAGVKVVGVHEDWSYGHIEIVVEHESFSLVDDGGPLSRIGVTIEARAAVPGLVVTT